MKNIGLTGFNETKIFKKSSKNRKSMNIFAASISDTSELINWSDGRDFRKNEKTTQDFLNRIKIHQSLIIQRNILKVEPLI